MSLFTLFRKSPIIKSSRSILEQSELFTVPSIIVVQNPQITNITEENLGMLRRKMGENGFEIIDKPTYHKLTKSFVKNKGRIIRGEDAEKHLADQGTAAYLPSLNSAFIKDNPTVSDVLEEMFHAKQDRANRFSDEPTATLMTIKREIEAQHYLLSMTDKYKIPANEVEQTRQNLEYWENKLREEENKWKFMR